MDAAALADITEDSSTANLQAGEKITVKNLLYCLLLASANEAANVLAMAVSGDIPTFVELMNQRAQELGMAGTHFVNPHGLHNADHYSTAGHLPHVQAGHDPRDVPGDRLHRPLYRPRHQPVPATQAAQYQWPADLRQALRLHHGRHHRHQNRQHRRGGLLPGGCGPEKGGTRWSPWFWGPKTPRTAGAMSSASNSPRASGCSTGALPISPTPPCWMRETYLKELPVRFSSEASHVVVRPTRSVQVMVPGTYDPERLELASASTGMWPPPPLKRGISWAPSP